MFSHFSVREVEKKCTSPGVKIFVALSAQIASSGLSFLLKDQNCDRCEVLLIALETVRGELTRYCMPLFLGVALGIFTRAHDTLAVQRR